MLLCRMQDWFLFLKSGTVPFPERRGRVVGTLRELQQCLVGRFRSANRVVRQNEFVHGCVVGGGRGLNLCLRESWRLGIGVGIKYRRRRHGVARPKAETAHFLRVRFARDRIGQMWNPARMPRRQTSRKTGDREIKTAPEKMDRAALAAEMRTEFFEYAIALRQHAPKTVGVFRIIRSMLLVLFERNRGLNFVRRRVDRSVDLELAQRVHHFAIKCRNRFWTQFDNLRSSVGFQDAQFVIDEIETNLKNSSVMRDWGSRQAPRRQIQRDVPGMIGPRCEREPNFPDDLRPHVKRRAGVFPFRKWKRRPNFTAAFVVN